MAREGDVGVIISEFGHFVGVDRQVLDHFREVPVLINMKKVGVHQLLSSAAGGNKIVSDKVGGELLSKTGGRKPETATKNKRKMAPESRLCQREKVWRAPAFVERNRQIIK